MKKVVFVTSHLESGSHQLVLALNKHPDIDMHNTGAEYQHLFNVESLTNYRSLDFEGEHLSSLDDLKPNIIYAPICGDHLLYNFKFSCLSLYESCYFIYVIRSAKSSLNEIVRHHPNYTPQTANKYYCYRLRRICEMAKRTPNAVFLTWDDLAGGFGVPEISDYLGLDTSISIGEFKKSELDEIPIDLVNHAQDSFERHLFFAKKLNLKFARRSQA